MIRARFFAAFLLMSAPLSVSAEEEASMIMQRHSEPGEADDIFVFVGEQISYVPLDLSCNNCMVFDDWHTARYRVSEWIHGLPPGPELEFDVAEHAILLPFGQSRYSLVFVETHGDDLALVKYQQVAVYPTADGSFASCGPFSTGDGEAFDPEDPKMKEIEFTPRLVVDDARRLSGFGRSRAYDPRWHTVVDDKVLCRRGIPVSELVTAMVRNHDMLKAALPDLAGAPR